MISPEKNTKKYAMNLFASIELELPCHANISPHEINVKLTKYFVSAKNKDISKKKPKKTIEINTTVKDRVYKDD